MWRDRSGQGCHAVFPKARWLTSPADRLNGLPVVSIGSSPGAFLSSGSSVFGAGAAASGFTVVAVWKVLSDALGGGGHPLGLKGSDDKVGSFSLGEWNEGLGLDKWRNVSSAPASLGVASGSVVWGAWSRSASGAVVWRLDGLTTATGGGWMWSGTAASDVAWATQACSVGKGIILAEMLVWLTVLDEAQRTSLDGYLRQKWGAPTSGTPAIPATIVGSSLPPPVVIPPGAFQYSTDITGTLRQSNGTEATLAGQTVTSWRRPDGSTVTGTLMTMVAPQGGVQGIRTVFSGRTGVVTRTTNKPYGWKVDANLALNNGNTARNTTWFLTFAIPRDASGLTTYVDSSPGGDWRPTILRCCGIFVVGEWGAGNTQLSIYTWDKVKLLTTNIYKYAPLAGPIVLAIRIRSVDATHSYLSYVPLTDGTTAPVMSSEVSINASGTTANQSAFMPGDPGDIYDGQIYPHGMVLYDFRAFNTALSDAQVLAVYNTLRESYVVPRVVGSAVVEGDLVFDATRSAAGDIVAAHYGALDPTVSPPVAEWWSRNRTMKLLPKPGLMSVYTVDALGRGNSIALTNRNDVFYAQPTGGNPETLPTYNRTICVAFEVTEYNAYQFPMGKLSTDRTASTGWYVELYDKSLLLRVGLGGAENNVSGTLNAAMKNGDRYVVAIQIANQGANTVLYLRGSGMPTTSVKTVSNKTYTEIMDHLVFGNGNYSTPRNNGTAPKLCEIRLSANALSQSEFEAFYDDVDARWGTVIGLYVAFPKLVDGATNVKLNNAAGAVTSDTNIKPSLSMFRMSAYFNGSSYLTSSGQTAGQLVLPGNFSVCGWVRLGVNTGTVSYPLFDLGGFDGGIYFDVGVTMWICNSYPFVNVSPYFPANTWVYFVLARSGTTLTLHCNGVLRGTTTNSSTINASNRALWMGKAYHENIPYLVCRDTWHGTQLLHRPRLRPSDLQGNGHRRHGRADGSVVIAPQRTTGSGQQGKKRRDLFPSACLSVTCIFFAWTPFPHRGRRCRTDGVPASCGAGEAARATVDRAVVVGSRAGLRHTTPRPGRPRFRASIVAPGAAGPHSRPPAKRALVRTNARVRTHGNRLCRPFSLAPTRQGAHTTRQTGSLSPRSAVCFRWMMLGRRLRKANRSPCVCGACRDPLRCSPGMMGWHGATGERRAKTNHAVVVVRIPRSVPHTVPRPRQPGLPASIVPRPTVDRHSRPPAKRVVIGRTKRPSRTHRHSDGGHPPTRRPSMQCG